MDIEQEILGFSPNSEPIILYTLTNSSGTKIKLINIGAAVVSVEFKDKFGVARDIVLGYRTFEEYLKDSVFFGKTIGRYAGRIAGGKFTINETQYRLTVNSGRNTLNGGSVGFQSKVWGSRVEKDSIVFSYQSANNEEGFPGEFGIEVDYSLSENNELIITFLGRTSEDCVVNLTNNTIFNLNGEGNGDIYSHLLKVNASHYLPIDRNLIPTGELKSVKNSVMDFTSPKAIGKDIQSCEEQMDFINGYDHNFVIDNWKAGQLCEVATLYSIDSGIELKVSSTLPSVGFHSANNIYGSGLSKKGIEHDNHQGVGLNCQFFPDSPNQSDFPTTLLKSDQIYDEIIIYKLNIQ